MNNKIHAKFVTPAETLLRLTRDIITGQGHITRHTSSRYHTNIEYEKMKSLLKLALDGQLGRISTDEGTRIAEAMEKLDELYKKNRRLPRRPPAQTTKELL